MTNFSKNLASGTAGFVQTILLIVTAICASLLVYISYRFEENAYMALLGPIGIDGLTQNSTFTIAQGLAAGLNGAKIALVFIVAKMVVAKTGGTFAARTLRGFILILSLVMTLMIVAGQTVSPNAEARVEELQAEVRDRQAREATDINQRIDERIANTRSRFTTEAATIYQDHKARLADLNAKLDVERKIGKGKHFRGPRYEELERMIGLEVGQTTARLDAFRVEESQRTNEIEAERSARLDVLETDTVAALASLQLDRVFGSIEAQHPYILRAVEIVRTFVPKDWQVTPVQITIFLALLLSLTIELAPLIMFGFVFRIVAHAGQPQATEHLQSIAANRTEPPKTAQPGPNRKTGETEDPVFRSSNSQTAE